MTSPAPRPGAHVVVCVGPGGVGKTTTAAALAPHLAEHTFALVLTSPLSRAAETCALAGFADRAVPTEDLLEWDYGDYDGRTTHDIRGERPGWTLWADGVPGGETAASVGRRADRVIERARAETGDTLCFAHGHILRVLAARWIGFSAAAGQHFLLDTGMLSVLGDYQGSPAVETWNLLDRLGKGTTKISSLPVSSET